MHALMKIQVGDTDTDTGTTFRFRHTNKMGKKQKRIQEKKRLTLAPSWSQMGARVLQWPHQGA